MSDIKEEIEKQAILSNKKLGIFLDSTELYRWKDLPHPPVCLSRIFILSKKDIAEIFISEISYYEWIKHVVTENVKKKDIITSAIQLKANSSDENLFLKKSLPIMDAEEYLESREGIVEKVIGKINKCINENDIKIRNYNSLYLTESYYDILYLRGMFINNTDKKHIPDSIILHTFFCLAKEKIFDELILLSQDKDLEKAFQNKMKEHSNVYFFKDYKILLEKFEPYWPRTDMEWEAFFIYEINRNSLEEIFKKNEYIILEKLDNYVENDLDLLDFPADDDLPASFYVYSVDRVGEINIIEKKFEQVIDWRDGLISFPIVFQFSYTIKAKDRESFFMQMKDCKWEIQADIYISFDKENSTYSLERAIFQQIDIIEEISDLYG